MDLTSKTLPDNDILYCGKATFTLESIASGKRYTYRINKVADENDQRPPVHFVSLLTGPDNLSDYQYLGRAFPETGTFRTTRASKLPLDSDPVRGIVWLLSKFHAGMTCATMPEAMKLHWAGRCQRCGRTLTVPSSIDARLGPDCAKKM